MSSELETIRRALKGLTTAQMADVLEAVKDQIMENNTDYMMDATLDFVINGLQNITCELMNF